jgi:large subunit ribosomal protein L7Ae
MRAKSCNGLSQPRPERGNFSLFFYLIIFILKEENKMTGKEISKEDVDKVLEAIEIAKSTGKIKKGTNEVTKSVERGTAKIVAVAKDASPPEIVMHIPMLAEEKDVLCVEVPSKEELGASAGIDVPTASVAVVQEGESKKLIKELTEKLAVKKEEKAEEAKEEKAEEKKEEKTEEAKEEKAEEKKEEKEEKKTK